MAILTPYPFVKPQFFTTPGVPAAGYLLFTYDAGTADKRDTYQDSSQSVLNTNPIELDAGGRADIYLLPTDYKFVLAPPTDTDPPTSPIWTMDNVPALGLFATNTDVDGVAGETLAENNAVFISSGGGGTTAGRWYKTDADATSFVTALAAGSVAIGFVTGAASTADPITVRTGGRVTGLSGLTPGAAYFVSLTAGAITSTDPGPTDYSVIIGVADTTTSLVLTPTPADVAGVAGNAVYHGLINTGVQYIRGIKHFSDAPLVSITGSVGGTEATVGGSFFRDVTEYSAVAGSTNLVFTDTTIPANTLSSNGMAVRVTAGSSTADTGANAKEVNLLIGTGTQHPLRAQSTTNGSWVAEALVVRIDSDSADITSIRGVVTGPGGSVLRKNGLDFTAAIVMQTLATTAAVSTTGQTFFIAEKVG